MKKPTKLDDWKFGLKAVKYTDPATGETRYGIPETYSAQAKAAFKRNLVLIKDEVYPSVVELPFAEVEELSGTYDPDSPVEKYRNRIQREHDKRAKAVRADGKLHAGHMFSIGVADGGADYVVTKVHKTNCDIEWRGFWDDRYTDHHFGWGGRFPINEIMRYVDRARALANLMKG